MKIPSLNTLPMLAFITVLLGNTQITFARDQLTPEEFAIGKQTYFQYCAGCHGSMRQGATGPELTADSLGHYTGTEIISIITNGTDGGMPAWGSSGILTERIIEIMSRYLLAEPPIPPTWRMSDVRSSWRMFTPPDLRPTAKQNALNLNNLFAVTLRDAGQVALIDGDTKGIVNIIKTGYAVHISRFSSSGRYLYTIGRDGVVTQIDLWMTVPDSVGEVRIAIESRSIESSKFPGYEDKFLVAGGYSPNQFVILNGETLEPIKLVDTTGFSPDGAKSRIAAIVSSRQFPEFILNLKETGRILLYSYASNSFGQTTVLQAPPFLHDGGWDKTKRYFMAAANKSDKVAVVDSLQRTLVATVDVGKIPHPGRGAAFTDPEFGNVWATGHLGDSTVSVIATDSDSPRAWTVVRTLPMPGTGSLFIKSHPASTHLWVDMTLNPDAEIAGQLVVYSINDLGKPPKIIRLKDLVDLGEGQKRLVQPEYNVTGDEVWVSVWNAQNLRSAIVVLDDKTMTLKHLITDERLITPTGKFNNLNTREDVY